MIKKIIYTTTIILILQFQLFATESIYEIKFKVDNQIITNYDLYKEVNYLKALNKNITKLDEKKILSIASNSLIKEKIKQNEIEKYYNIDYQSSNIDPVINTFIEELGLGNMNDFINYIANFELDINEIRKKLIIEQTWNKLIVDLYESQIEINDKKINEDLKSIIDNKKNQKVYNLSEIIFSANNNSEFNIKYEEIKNSIEKIGFKETAKIFSISDSSISNGSVGWLRENQLNKKVLNELSKLEKQQVSEPLTIAGGFLILKIDDIKYELVENSDKESEFSKLLIKEKNRQLNEFSIIHYKKISNKTYLEKL